MKFGIDESPEDRLFKAALALDPADRPAFIANGANGDAELEAAVLTLLEGYQIEGGDGGETITGEARSTQREFADPSEHAGAVIGNFELVRRIGEGGMGTVWEAQQEKPIARTVALKLVKPGMDTREVVARFERERQTLAQMKHAGIAQVFEAGATPLGRLYFAMELIDGLVVSDYVRQNELAVRDRIELIIDACSALEHAHHKGVIHRDLKPSNLLVTEEGDLKIIDFGVAKVSQESGEAAASQIFTIQNQVIGTPAYMSPEQAANTSAIDTRSDVYSLGVVLYELLAGAPPFDPDRLASTGIAEMQKILLEEEPPIPSTRFTKARQAGDSSAEGLESIHRFESDLDWIVMKALAKEPQRRYRSAAAFAEDLQRYLDGDVVTAVPPTLSYRLGKFVRRHKLAVAAASAVVAALVLGLIASLIQVQRVKQAQRETLLSIADMQANNGARAADDGETAKAALWFAKAAHTAEADPDRVLANARRTVAWRQDLRSVVRAFDSGEDHIEWMLWNPIHPVLSVSSAASGDLQHWDLRGLEQRWQPEVSGTQLAEWDRSGKRLATLGDGRLHVLDYPSGKSAATLEQSGITTCAWMPDQEWLAVGSVQGAQLWHPGTGQTSPIPGSGHVFHLAIDKGGERLLVHRHHSVEVRSAAAPFALLHPPQPSLHETQAIFLGSGQRYAVLLEGWTCVIRDSDSGEERARYEGTRSGGRGLRASSDGRFLSRRHQPLIDLQNRRTVPVPKHGGSWRDSAFHPQSGLFASGGYDNTIRFWSPERGTEVGAIEGLFNPPITLAFSPDGGHLAAAENGFVRVWRSSATASIRTIQPPDAVDSMAALSPDGRHLLPSGYSRAGGALRLTRLYDTRSAEPAGPEIDPQGLLIDAAFHPAGKQVALSVSTTADRTPAGFKTTTRDENGMFAIGSNGGGSGNIQLWDPHTGARLGDPIPMPSEPRGLAWHPAGQHVGVLCANGETVEITLPVREVRTLLQQPEPLNAPDAIANNGRCTYSLDGRLLACWGGGEWAPVWDRESEKRIYPSVMDASTRAGSFDLQLHEDVIVRTWLRARGEIHFIDPRAGTELVPPMAYDNWPMICRLDATGTRLLTGGGDNIAQVWDWRGRQPLGPALEHPSGILAGTFLPGDSATVVTGGYPAALSFWNYRTGLPSGPAIPTGPTLQLQTTADGKTLVAAGAYGGRILLIDLASALPGPVLPPDSALQLAELEASAEVMETGGVLRLNITQWLEKWRNFRQNHPDFSGHALGK